MSRQIVLKSWQRFRRDFIPPDAPPIQLQEMERAYYAGCSAVFMGLVKALDPGKEPTEADLRVMSELRDELQAWAENILTNAPKH